MLRFNQSKQPQVRNYSSRREQWRLLLLVLSLGVVIFVMRAIRQPKNVEPVERAFAEEPAKADEERRVSAPRSNPSVSGAVSQPANVQRSADSPERKELAWETPWPQFQRQALEAIEDNTYFRNAEHDAWFRFLELLQGTSQEKIEAAPSTEVDYVQLVDQPGFYRGRFVTVYGWVRQVTPQTPAANDLGIETYYRVVVQPTDGVNRPIFVYCLELPPELRARDHAAGSIRVTGLFFKNLSYPWQGGVGIAPVIVAKSLKYSGAAPGNPGVATRPPIRSDAWTNAKPQAGVEDVSESVSAKSMSFRDVLALAEWDVSRLAAFDDGKPFSNDQRLQALHLLRRLRSFNSASLEDWVHEGLSPHSMMSGPEEYRGQLVRLAGRVTKVSKQTLDAADAARLEMPEYFECDLMLDKQAGKATVLTTRVPRGWLSAQTLDEPASAVALYLKRLAGDDPPASIWLAKELAWHPTMTDEPRVSLGKSILGSLGADIGLLDGIRSRGSIRGSEREAFYQTLDAVGRIGSHQLTRIALSNLEQERDRWMREYKTATDQPRRALAYEVVRRANEGRFSVAPLFNEPDRHIGQLFTFDGIARRVVRVEVGAPQDGGPSDVLRRFGFDHYYEMEVFTDDSQNYPLVFCVREIPQGFPTGSNLHEPVRVAGFFFKDWLYTTRGAMNAEAGDAKEAAARSQLAPLLIGRSPLNLQVDEEGGNLARLVGGSLFLLGLVSFGAAAWWFARDDRKFSKRTRSANFSLDPGQSLKELHLEALVEPITDSGSSLHDINDSP